MLNDDAACSCGCPGWEESWPHWWRELCVDTWFWADHAWLLSAEAASNGWLTEWLEYRASHPRPTFKKTLVGLAGSTRPLG